MANLKSAQKRIRINESKRARNQAYRTKMRTKIKQVEALIEANDIEKAKTAFQEASQVIDQVIQKGVVHRNHGNRQKARLAKKLNQISG